MGEPDFPVVRSHLTQLCEFWVLCAKLVPPCTCTPPPEVELFLQFRYKEVDFFRPFFFIGRQLFPWPHALCVVSLVVRAVVCRYVVTACRLTGFFFYGT